MPGDVGASLAQLQASLQRGEYLAVLDRGRQLLAQADDDLRLHVLLANCGHSRCLVVSISSATRRAEPNDRAAH